MLEVTDAVVRYGAITALHGISFNVEQGEIVTLLGANGAGKSTTLRMLSGLHAPFSGTIMFDGHGRHRDQGPRRARRWASATSPRAGGSSRR